MRGQHLSLSSALLGALWCSTSALAASQCFYPNGAVHTKGQPCDPDAAASGKNVACCEGTHTCLSNGLCWDVVFNHVIRGGCTDSQWEDSACPKYCYGSVQGGDLGNLRQCDGQNDNWTCGQNVSDCSGPFTVPYGYVSDKRNSSENNILAAGSSTTSNSNESSTAATVTVTADPDSAATSSVTMGVGLGAGLGVGIPLLLALAVALFFLHKAKKELAGLKATHGSSDATTLGTHEYKSPGAPSYATPAYQSGYGDQGVAPQHQYGDQGVAPQHQYETQQSSTGYQPIQQQATGSSLAHNQGIASPQELEARQGAVEVGGSPHMQH